MLEFNHPKNNHHITSGSASVKMKKRSNILTILGITIVVMFGLNTIYSTSDDRRQITFYTTYAYQEGDDWVVPARVWVNKERRWLQSFVTWSLDLTSDYTDRQIEIFRERLRFIVADSKSRRTVSLTIQGDPDETRYRIENDLGETPRTGRNGIITGSLRIPIDKIEELFSSENTVDKWISVSIRSGRYRGVGRIQLLNPEGLSVISDIDDTVKVTEIPAGSNVVIENTFFKEYEAAPGMAELYEEWSDASYHYVSGSPWQLFNSLSGFLFSNKAGFPEGSFHMKSARKNPLTIATWRDLSEFITNENLTFEQKINQISTIFRHLPGRKFILVGDSGERDPDVYRTILERFPDQVKDIYIRDVINDRELNPERLEGMQIIPAPTILRARNQSDR